MRLRGNKATEVKRAWKQKRIARKIKEILVIDMKLVPWNRLTEKKAIDLFLEAKKIKLSKSTLTEKKYLVMRCFDASEIKARHRSRKMAFGYKNYLRSKQWQDKREMMFKLRGRKCEVCGDMESKLQIHHLHYRTLYKEQPQDLQILCGSCHQNWHDVNNIQIIRNDI